MMVVKLCIKTGIVEIERRVGDERRKQEAWDAMIQERRVVKARREEERLLEERVIVRPTAQQLLQWGRRVGLK
jgi:hypothetical protein